MHTNTHICTNTYAITISENEARKLKGSKKRDMETFIDRNEREKCYNSIIISKIIKGYETFQLKRRNSLVF